MVNKIYRNLKNGYNYIVTELCKIKINDEWEEGVVYRRVGENQTYVRTIQNFNEKFRLHRMEEVNRNKELLEMVNIIASKNT